MIAYLILLIGILFPWAYGRYEAIGDYEKIQADGSADSLKEAFHSNNAIKRGIAILLVCAMLTAFGNTFAGLSLWLLPALLLYSIAAFGYKFTTKLNTLRGLPKWYASPDPRASKTDRFIQEWAWQLDIKPATFSAILHTVFLVLSALVLIALVYFQALK